MEEDLLNTSVDSWKDDEDVNKIIDLRNTQDTKLNVGGTQGDKYKLTNNNKQYFAKRLVAGDSRTKHLLEIASSSAFISCFSHTPYPVGIKNIQGEDFAVLRFDEHCVNNVDKETKTALKAFMDSFCTVKYRDLFINKDRHKTYWEKLPEKMKKYIIQICVHQFFFSFFDRKYDNIIITDNGIHHIDTDINGVGDRFMFAVNGHQDRYNKVKAFIIFLQKISPNDASLTNLFQTEINKIKNIDYKKFINRYIRNCIVLGITAQDAYSYLKEHVISNMLNFFKTTLTECYEFEDANTQNNEYFKILKKGFTETKNIIENNIILKKIMSNDKMPNDEGEKWFTNEFLQREKELNINKTTSLSTNNFCNDCADKCLSIFRNCCWL